MKNYTQERFLKFYGISDLIKKVENIKQAHKIKSKKLKHKLKGMDIHFVEVNDYGVAVDVSFLNKELLQYMRNEDDSFIEKVYKENDVVYSTH